MTTNDPSSHAYDRDRHTYPASWTTRDSGRLDTIAKAQGVITALLAVTVLLFVVGIILGIVGYTKIADRLDNIEHSTAETARTVDQPAPVIP